MIGVLVGATVMIGSLATTPATPSVVATTDEPSCIEGCDELDRLPFEHPTWGPSDLVLSVRGDADAASCHLAVVDQRGGIRWEANGAGCGFGGSIFRPAPDADGNIFVQYSTGRYPGITVLRPVADGMSDFRSLPFSAPADGTTGRFDDSQLFDIEGDGRHEILSFESFNGRLRDELLNSWQFDSLLEARVIIEDWRIDYNEHRPHSAHGDLTPTEFARAWTINQPEAA